MNSYYGVTFRSQENVIEHYGVKGQKRGIRRYQNEDGSLTSEGRDHYGVGEARTGHAENGFQGRFGSTQKQAHEYRVRKFGKSSAKILGKKPQKLSPKEKAKRDARKKKIIAAAAGLTLAAIGAGIAVKQHNKVSRNLIETAKNKIHKKYVTKQNELDRRVDLTKNERLREQARLDSNRTKDMMDVYSRRTAKNVLGIGGRKNRDKAKAFVKENNLRKMKTSEIVEKRTGRIVEAAAKNRITGRFETVSEKKRRKIAERIVKSHRFDV